MCSAWIPVIVFGVPLVVIVLEYNWRVDRVADIRLTIAKLRLSIAELQFDVICSASVIEKNAPKVKKNT